MTIAVFIPGHPAPQGSKRHVGGGRMVENCKNVKPWRSDIRSALLTADGVPFERFHGPVYVGMEFVMPRPKSAPKRSTPPAIKKPDVDKLARAVLDAITSAGVWDDDSQVTSMTAGKRIAEIGQTPGLHLTIAYPVVQSVLEAA
jgi:crossover junction endodeoxyribonuclease RusA